MFGPSAEGVGLDDRAEDTTTWADVELDVQRCIAVSVATVEARLEKLENLAEVVLVGVGDGGEVVPSGALCLTEEACECDLADLCTCESEGAFGWKMDQQVGVFCVGCFERKAAQGPTELCEGDIPDVGFGTARKTDRIAAGGGRKKAREVLFADVIGPPHGDDHAAFLGFSLKSALGGLETKDLAQWVDPTIDMIKAFAQSE